MDKNNIVIRKFESRDREGLRKISCDTAFLGKPRTDFFDDDEILADALTLYFTDYEPGSCFVAVCSEKVVGYIVGAKDERVMDRVFKLKIAPLLFIKTARKGVLLKKNTWAFLLHGICSFLKGEFFTPSLSREYPAVLHINIDKNFRGLSVGSRLIEKYLNFLKEEKVGGVHCVTISEEAKTFFTKTGFKLLFKTKSTFLRFRLRRDFTCYIFGRKL